jgi:hypothetical protein
MTPRAPLYAHYHDSRIVARDAMSEDDLLDVDAFPNRSRVNNMVTFVGDREGMFLAAIVQRWRIAGLGGGTIVRRGSW